VKSISDIKFSRLTFSKAFVLLFYTPIILMILAFGSEFLLPNDGSSDRTHLISLLSTFIMISFVYFYRKKLKQ